MPFHWYCSSYKTLSILDLNLSIGSTHAKVSVCVRGTRIGNVRVFTCNGLEKKFRQIFIEGAIVFPF